ncbi:MAG: PEF-CTERM sorting domain-containing protein [Euryarchaeota archaeon]|nr:PEF-CTERM sorting domain-containing protein [Euryarchaeota archaeon]
MKMKYIVVIAMALMMVLGAGVASAKSVYVIADINVPSVPGVPIQAYDLQPTNMIYQTTNYIPDRDGGAVGIAIDSDSGYLFVTFEFSNVLDIVDGTTMTTVGQTTAIGASNLAGIVVDQDKQKLYTIDRNTGKFYSYLWDAGTQTLTPEAGNGVALPGLSAGYGLALDEINDILYVADGSVVRSYDTATWTLQGSFAVSSGAMGIAVDAQNGWIYTAGWYNDKISKYDLVTSTETIQVVSGVSSLNGVTVDPATSNVFLTTKGGSGSHDDALIMFDSDLNELDVATAIGEPTGVCVPGKDVSFNPLNLAKTDGVTQVYQGGTLTYTISYDNAQNNNPVTGVTIVDTLPAKVTYVSSTGGTYDAVNHTVTWNIGTLAAGAPPATVSITVNVWGHIVIGTFLDNAVTIDSDDTAQTTQHDDDTEVVRPDQEIPEFPTIALPIAAILGLAFFFQRRRNE